MGQDGGGSRKELRESRKRENDQDPLWEKKNPVFNKRKDKCKKSLK